MGTEILGYTYPQRHSSPTQGAVQQASTQSESGVALVRDMLIRCADRAFEAFSGYSSEELDDTPLACYLAPMPETAGVAALWDAHRASEERTSYRAVFLCKDGARKRVQVHVRPMRQSGSRLELVELEPICDDEPPEQPEVAPSEMNSLGAMIGHIAHDFNNIFQRILGPADLLMALGQPDERERKCLSQIIHGCKKGGSVIRSLQAFTRQDGIIREMVNIQDAVETVAKKLQKTTPDDVIVMAQVPEPLWPVDADADQMARALMELGTNAVEAAGNEGRVVFRAENLELPAQTAHNGEGAEPARWVIITVADDGRGIDEASTEMIFRPFFTTKPRASHSGLGLAVARSIVEAHGGTLDVESSSEGGACFAIRLPAGVSAGVLDVERPGLNTAGGDGCATILVVEDDETVSWTTRNVLQLAGHTAIAALDGDQAIEKYRERNGSIDLVLLDLVMPGMNGEECLARLLEIDPNVRVVVASGLLTDDERRRRLDDRVVGHIGKPYDAHALIDAVHGALAVTEA